MDPEVREANPGPCPVCGMSLEAEMTAATRPAARVEYVCPMHPEIVRSEPGSCPICGMALEPRTAAVDEKPDPELVSTDLWLAATRSLLSGRPVSAEVFLLTAPFIER